MAASRYHQAVSKPGVFFIAGVIGFIGLTGLASFVSRVPRVGADEWAMLISGLILLSLTALFLRFTLSPYLVL
ncbi:MAG: hypothetical protein AAGC68_16195, partial [Verrucomicrobiota bacterium]